MNKLQQRILALLILFYFPVSAGSVSNDAAGLAFEKIKALQGKWEGTARWIEIPNSEFKIAAVYSLTGKGTAVVEDLIVEGVKTMTSVYHLDGGMLRMTHYCGAGNQPRLIATPDDLKSDRLKFQLVDVTNLASPDAAHVSAAEIVFQEPSAFTLTFEFSRPGKKNTELIQLRKAG